MCFHLNSSMISNCYSSSVSQCVAAHTGMSCSVFAAVSGQKHSNGSSPPYSPDQAYCSIRWRSNKRYNLILKTFKTNPQASSKGASRCEESDESTVSLLKGTPSKGTPVTTTQGKSIIVLIVWELVNLQTFHSHKLCVLPPPPTPSPPASFPLHFLPSFPPTPSATSTTKCLLDYPLPPEFSREFVISFILSLWSQDSRTLQHRCLLYE